MLLKIISIMVPTILATVYFYFKPQHLKFILKKISDKRMSTPSEITLLMASSYFLFAKKGFNLSLTDELNKHIPETITNLIIYSLYIFILISIVIKAICLICERFKIFEREQISPDGLKLVCLKLNTEIESHINEYEKKDDTQGIKELCAHHHFAQNITLIVVKLIDHLSDSLKITKKNKDIFLSIYYVENFEIGMSLIDYDRVLGEFKELKRNQVSKLKYLTHWNPSSTHRYSKHIEVTTEKYKDYECVKAYKQGKHLHTKVAAKDYYCDPENPRAKTTKDFLCFFIEINEVTVGLVNIEFHNHNVFDTEDDMIQYIESDLLPFKYMIQYQFLKKRFLTLLTGVQPHG